MRALIRGWRSGAFVIGLIALSVGAARAEVDPRADILGIRPGMQLSEALAKLQAENATRKVEALMDEAFAHYGGRQFAARVVGMSEQGSRETIMMTIDGKRRILTIERVVVYDRRIIELPGPGVSLSDDLTPDAPNVKEVANALADKYGRTYTDNFAIGKLQWRYSYAGDGKGVTSNTACIPAGVGDPLHPAVGCNAGLLWAIEFLPQTGRANRMTVYTGYAPLMLENLRERADALRAAQQNAKGGAVPKL